MVADIRKKKGFAAGATNSMVLVAVASPVATRRSHENFFDNPVTTSLILRTTSQRIRSGTYSFNVIQKHAAARRRRDRSFLSAAQQTADESDAYF
jgi:hypothetical protein